MHQPDLTRIPEFYHGYVQQAHGSGLQEAFKSHSSKCVDFFEQIPEEKASHRYAPGKWSIKEVLQHIIDTERIFAYRALCISRNEKKPLPGFDENDYVVYSKADSRNWKDLLEEFSIVRKSSELLFDSFDDEQLLAGGISNEQPIYVAGIGYILIGHCQHHINIIRERYL